MASGRRGFRLTIGRLMGLIAALAALLAAGIYRRANLDVDRATISANLAALRGGDAAARRRAAADLSQVRPDRPAPVEAALAEALLGDTDPGVRASAAHSLMWVVEQGRIGQPPGVLGPSDPTFAPARAFLRALGDPDARVRNGAVNGIIAVQEADLVDPGLTAAIQPGLFGLLDDPEPATRASAILALGWTKPPPEAARDRALGLLVVDPELRVRRAAVMALVAGWPAPDLYLPLMARWASLPEGTERDEILRLLLEKVSPPPGSIPMLVDLMATDPTAARQVPDALAKLGRQARPWLGAIARVADRELADPATIFFPAVVALVRVDPDSPEAQAVLPVIARRLVDETDEARRNWFTAALRRAGRSAGPAVPALRAALQSPLAAVRLDAAQLLGGIGPAATSAIGDLEPLARADPDPSARRAASRALEKLRPHASTTAPPE